MDHTQYGEDAGVRGELLEDWRHEEGHRKYGEDGGVHVELLEDQDMLEGVEVVLVELVHDIAGPGAAVAGGQRPEPGRVPHQAHAEAGRRQVEPGRQVRVVRQGGGVWQRRGAEVY